MMQDIRVEIYSRFVRNS